MARTVLVVGGAGAFGSRLVTGLIETTSFDVVIAGRDLRRAGARAAAVGAERARAMRIDTATVTAAELRATGAFVVVDAAGPFQGPMAWRLWFLPLPHWLMPPTVCFERGAGDRFVFDIDVRFPIVGQLVHYRGWLAQK